MAIVWPSNLTLPGLVTPGANFFRTDDRYSLLRSGFVADALASLSALMLCRFLNLPFPCPFIHSISFGFRTLEYALRKSFHISALSTGRPSAFLQRCVRHSPIARL